MALVHIMLNGKVTAVSAGAYKQNFKPFGYEIVSKTGKESENDSNPAEDEKTSVDDFEEEFDTQDDPEEESEEESDEEDDEDTDLSEIPLSEQSFDQLKAYAGQLGVDITGLKSKKEIKASIREYLKEQ